ENGWLVEEFWALGLGTFCLLFAAGFGLAFGLKISIERRRNRPKASSSSARASMRKHPNSCNF
ncbi:MAG: hypothetical protein VW008_05490, partial [Aquiluna sp.]